MDGSALRTMPSKARFAQPTPTILFPSWNFTIDKVFTYDPPAPSLEWHESVDSLDLIEPALLSVCDSNGAPPNNYETMSEQKMKPVSQSSNQSSNESQGNQPKVMTESAGAAHNRWTDHLVKRRDARESTLDVDLQRSQQVLKEIIKDQEQYLPKNLREAFRRAHSKRACLRMKYERSLKVRSDGINDTLKAVEKASESLTAVASNPDLEAAIGNFAVFAKMLTNTVDSVQKVVDNVKSGFEMPNLVRFGIIASTTLAQIFMLRSTSIIFLLLEIVKICTYFIPTNMLSKVTELKSFVISSFKDIRSTLSPKKAQKGFEVSSNGYSPKESVKSTNMVTHFVRKVTALITGSSEEDVRKLGSLRSVGDLGRSLNNVNLGMATIVKWAHYLFESIQQLLSRHVGSAVLPEGEVKQFNTDYCDILEVDPEDFGKLQFAEKAKKLKEKAIDLKRRIESGELKLNKVAEIVLNRNINNVLNFYKENRTAILSVIGSRKARKTPFVWQFFGEPGSGKSTVMKLTGVTLTQFENCGRQYESEEEDLIYYVSNTSYMDGYRMQPVHIHDDQWQSRNGEVSGGNEYLSFITKISNTNFQVDMAAIQNKGLPFVCDLYIGSTNNPFPNPSDVANVTALFRRRQMLVGVVSRNWHTEEPIFNFDYGPGYEELNWMAFRQFDPIDPTKIGNHVKDAEANLKNGTPLNETWVPFHEIAAIGAEKFRKHLKDADPEFRDGKNLPAGLKNLSLGIVRKSAPGAASTSNTQTTNAEVHEVRADGPCFRRDLEWEIGYEDEEPPSEPSSDEEFDSDEEMEVEEEIETAVIDLSFERDFFDGEPHPANFEAMMNHQQAMIFCDHGCVEHPWVCCCDRYVCTGNNYVRMFCGAYGFYSDEDNTGTFSTERIPMDHTEVEWYNELTAREVNVPLQFQHYMDALEVIPNHGWFSMFGNSTDKKEEEPAGQEMRIMYDLSSDDLIETITKEVESDKTDWQKPEFWVEVVGVVISIAAIAGVLMLIKSYYDKVRNRTEAEKISETTTAILDVIHENENISSDVSAQIEGILIDAQARANGTYYESGVPFKGPQLRSVPLATLSVSKNSGSDNQMADRIRCMDNNLLKLRQRVPGKLGYKAISALGVFDRYFIVNKHFIDGSYYEEDSKEWVIEVYRFNVWTEMRIPVENMTTFGADVDLVCVRLPNGHQAFKDIRKYFAPLKTMTKRGGNMAMITRTLDGRVVSHSAPYREFGCISYDGYDLLKTWQYHVNGEMEGMCSSPVFDTSLCSIVGLHIATGPAENRKFAMVVSKELIDDIYKIVTGIWPNIIQDNTETDVTALIVDSNGGKISVEGTIEKFGEASKEAKQYTPKESKHVRSPIFGEFETDFEPAALCMSDKRISPEFLKPTIHEKGINKFAYPIMPWKAHHRRKASEVVAAKLACQRHNLEMRLLTDFEVLNGLDDGSLKPVDMDASPGFPWVKRKKSSVRGKLNIFENISPHQEKKIWQWKDNEQAREIKERMAMMEAEMREGRNVFWLAYSNIKDELRPKKKVKEANSRSFDCVPIEVTLLFRKYFGMFVAQTHLNCADMPISVGVDPHTQWTSLANRMLRRGDALIAGDYKNWDGSVAPEELADGVDDINNFYNDSQENKNVRELLVYGSTHMWTTVEDTIVRKHQGLPSGIPLTAVLNSLINWKRIMCCVQEICDDSGISLTPDEMVAEMDMLLYGDDHVVSLSSRLRKFVTFRTVKQKFEEHGIVYTDSRKSGNEFDFEKLEETSYLKRSFVPFAGFCYVAPLDINSIYKSLNWLHANKRIDSLDMLACVKNTAQEELALHGKVIYTEVRTKYNRCVQPLNDIDGAGQDRNLLIVPSYETMEERIRKRLGLFNF